MSKLITRQEAESILNRRFYNKVCCFTYPGYKSVFGKVDQIAIDHKGVIVIQINNERYTCSSESLNECLTLLTKNNGDNTGT